ncbi:hypothetical protein ACQP2T_58000 [Nonomuraea sp. CA-143628]|uniref:hypothetical protein n=1 Tax=Nonomuraea sp. CA-143628 TaxID=3239997 RepID=UPI003D90552D
MPNKSKSGNQGGAWGCLAVIAFVVVGCNALFVGNDQEPAAVASAPPITSRTISWPSWTPTPEPVEVIEDLDEDGTEERYDDDKDGDGVIKSRDRDDRDPDEGRRSPKRTPKPKPVAEPEPAPLARAHPGGFCGSPGAMGVASNGRTYICRDGHWRR